MRRVLRTPLPLPEGVPQVFHFAQKSSMKNLKKNTGIGKHSLSNACLWIRHAILTFMLKLQSTEILGGGWENPNIVVLIDETHLTRKKRKGIA